MERVVLLSAEGEPIGTAPKADVHGAATPLHLAFSCYLTDDAGRVLVTRRALTKRTWPGVWTNSFCGHPAPDEPTEDAVRRRARSELGIELRDLQVVLPDFRYRAVDASGVVENEVCPVFRAHLVGTPGELRPAVDEVAEHVWVDQGDLTRAARLTPWAFSPWLVLQLDRLDRPDVQPAPPTEAVA